MKLKDKLFKYHLLSIFIVLFVFSGLKAQSINESVKNSHIYNFLENMSIKYDIDFFTDIRPMRRNVLSNKLEEFFNKKLTITDKKRVKYYQKDFAFEKMYSSNDDRKISEFLKYGEINRLNLFKFYSKEFSFVIDPVVFVGYQFNDGIYHQASGISMHGRFKDNWGFYFKYNDNLELGDNLDRRKLFSTKTGVAQQNSKERSFMYSDTRGGITYGGEWGNLTFAKDYLHIGSSQYSSVIMSDKAPSFPFISLKVTPVSWFEYNFTHAWLKSNLVDSTSIRRINGVYPNREYSSESLNKYYVTHSFSFKPVDKLWLTFGESIIYGDKLDYIFFLPVFYRLADHYNSEGDAGAHSGSNAQLYFNASYVSQKLNSKFYFTAYIDEMSIDGLFGGGDHAQVYASTFGIKIINPILDNNYITIEYNAIRPYCYMNGDPLHTYESSSYQLGHWIGSNAVQLFVNIEQYLPYNINLNAYLNYVIKGERENIKAYYFSETSTYSLLSGVNSYFNEMGAQISFNPINRLFLNFELNYILKANKRFKNEFNKGKGFLISTSFSFGFH